MPTNFLYQPRPLVTSDSGVEPNLEEEVGAPAWKLEGQVIEQVRTL